MRCLLCSALEVLSISFAASTLLGGVVAAIVLLLARLLAMGGLSCYPFARSACLLGPGLCSLEVVCAVAFRSRAGLAIPSGSGRCAVPALTYLRHRCLDFGLFPSDVCARQARPRMLLAIQHFVPAHHDGGSVGRVFVRFCLNPAIVNLWLYDPGIWPHVACIFDVVWCALLRHMWHVVLYSLTEYKAFA